MDETHPHYQRLPSPTERDTLAALVPQYEAAMVPASAEYIGKSITMLAVAFPGGKSTDEEATTRHRLYRDGLADIPPDVLAGACRDAIRTCQFFPTVKDLRDRCTELQMREFRLARIKHLIAKHDAEYRAPEAEEPMTAAQKAEMDLIRKKFGLAA